MFLQNIFQMLVKEEGWHPTTEAETLLPAEMLPELSEMLCHGGRAGDVEQSLTCFILKQLSFHFSEVCTKPADLPEVV